MATTLDQVNGWTIRQWQKAYEDSLFDVSILLSLRAELDAQDSAWIHIATVEQVETQISHLQALLDAQGGDLNRLPLYGVPFAVKDNIDVGGWPTTAACPEFRFVAEEDAAVVQLLRQAGAIVLGKTNLDQFATGLVGTRSPYGVVPSSFAEEWIGGGSSSGSAAVVSRGFVPFSLGTDTAGSGRVPAAFHNIVGWKPTRGRFSNRGVLPACRTLDCVSVFALTIDDAELVASFASASDLLDPYSREATSHSAHFPERPRLAYPDSLEFFGDEESASLFGSQLEVLRKQGVSLEVVDFQPFRELAELLYQGPWVAERTLVISSLLERSPGAVHPVVRDIIRGGFDYSAMQAFDAEYKKAELARKIQTSLSGFDALVVPTTPTHYRVEEVLADPIRTNSRLGTYTNFTNLADLSALALPAGFRANGLPVGITLLGPAFREEALASFARKWQRWLDLPLGVTGRPFHAAEAPRGLAREEDRVLVAVVGAHLSGLPLNHQLTSRGAVLVESTRSAAHYRLYALPRTTPPKPGLVRSESGQPIELEVWSMGLDVFGSFVAEVPAPLGIGNVELEDGRVVKGFICEPSALEGALEITELGGFRAYLATKASLPSQEA